MKVNVKPNFISPYPKGRKLGFTRKTGGFPFTVLFKVVLPMGLEKSLETGPKPQEMLHFVQHDTCFPMGREVGLERLRDDVTLLQWVLL